MDTKILPGDVLFDWGTDWVSEAIEGITKGPSHVAMFINEVTVAEAQGGRAIGITPLSSYTNSNNRLEVWTDPTLTDGQRVEMVNFAKTMYGESYDYLLIPLEFLHFKLNFDISWFHEHKHKICSTYINVISRHVGKIWAGDDAAPVDLFKYGVLKKKLLLKK